MIDRVNKLRTSFGKSLDALLISSSYNIGYLSGFFGFSKIEREGYMFVTREHVYFFASGLNSEAVSEHIEAFPNTSLVQISARNPLTRKAILDIVKKEKIKRIGFEKNNLTYKEYESLAELVATEDLVENLRAIKTQEEINAIENVCKIGDKVFDFVLGKIKLGITEKKLAFEIELFIRRQDAELSFPSIVAFGANSSIPHHVTGDQKLEANSLVLFDFGVRINNFCSDMTRVVFLGKATSKQKLIYKTVLESQQRAVEKITINCRARDIDKIARDYIVKKGFPTIPHSLGHGIGLEVHELPRLSPRSKNKLKPGMVFSLEPGIYIPGSGGVRIEDLVVLEKNGPRFLTKASKKLIEI